MSGQLNFTTPPKFCEKFGDVIPVAGDVVLKNGGARERRARRCEN